MPGELGIEVIFALPYHPWSKGKPERRHRSVKSECIRPGVPLSLEDARRLVAEYVAHCDTVRLHSAIGCVTPVDKLEGREREISVGRDRKLHEAREHGKAARRSANAVAVA